MASYIEILEALAPETGPVPAADIAAKLNTKVNLINTSLTRMLEKKPPWLDRNEEGDYTITEEGRLQLNPPTEESGKTTEYQQFIRFGQRIGVTEDIVTLTADHVWRGGDYTDLKWVWKAMTEQGVRSDLAKRWWHNWRSYLHQAIPSELEAELGGGKQVATTAAGASSAGESKESEAEEGKRAYILDANDMPLNVGEGAGDLDYKDAVRLSGIKLAGKVRAAAAGGGNTTPQDQVTFIEAVVNAFKTFMEATGGNGSNKPLVITQGQDGVQIREVKDGEPVVIERSTGGADIHHTWVVDQEGNSRELQPGEPFVVKQQAPPGRGSTPEATKAYIIHPDGTYEEKKAGEPIIIRQEGAGNRPGILLNARIGDGEPFTINLDDYFRLEDHKAKKERDQESQDMKMQTLGALKDLVGKAAKALGRMGEE